MIQNAALPSDEPVEEHLRDQLAQGDAFLESAAPIMRHLLSGEHSGAFADEIVARVRGAVGDLATQLLAAISASPDPVAHDPVAHDQAALDELSAALLHIPGLLGHLHAMALEWQLTERLQARLALDPALPPLLQALLASEDEATAALAMSLLAAQARFAQNQRRMQMPLRELPADLLHGALVALRGLGISGEAANVAAAEASIREDYDESRTRVALAARLVTGMGGGAVAALAVTHAGLALFATALGVASAQDRDIVLLSIGGAPAARLGLALRAAGLRHEAIEEQVALLHPDAVRGVEWDRIEPDRAAELLAAPIPHGGL